MERMDTEVENDVEVMLTLPGKYHVIMHNDDVTTMDFVVYVLKRVFGMEKSRAVQVMLSIHHSDKAIVGTYVKSIAEAKVATCRELAAREKFPLQVTMEKE